MSGSKKSVRPSALSTKDAFCTEFTQKPRPLPIFESFATFERHCTSARARYGSILGSQYLC